MSSVVFILSIAIIVSCFYLLNRRPKNFPPGPRGLPLVGYIPFLGANAQETFFKLKHKYGPIMSVQIGREYWVVLNDFETIYEALVKQKESFSGRPSNFLFDVITKGRGVAGADYGTKLKSLKKFGYHTLKSFGVGSRTMEQNVIDEMAWLIECLTTKGEKTVQAKITQAVCNIVSRVTFGSRFDYDDKRFNHMIEVIHKVFSDTQEAKNIGLMMLAPGLRFFPPFKQTVKKFVDDFKIFFGYFEDIIADHEEKFDENNIRDFVDAFLKQIKDTGENAATFNRLQLVQTVRDLIDGGTGTVSTTLCWAILCFAHYPKYQERIYEEVTEVIGQNGTSSMEYQDKMPFTCAFIEEVMRHRTLAPFGVLHKTTHQATVNGYTIPKNTLIAPNVWAVHFDPQYFKNPREFRPERFINSDGIFVKSNHVISFSMGPRQCMGENLARMELFIILTTIIQELKIIHCPEKTLPSFEKGHFNMLIYEPPSFDVLFQKR